MGISMTNSAYVHLSPRLQTSRLPHLSSRVGDICHHIKASGSEYVAIRRF
jgi:hypothetical protein